MAKDRVELEIKLCGAAPVLSALPQSKLFKKLNLNEGRWERLESIYFDTPDRRLAKVGLSLRRRRGRRGITQAVKSGSESGVVSRREWERRLSNGATFPAPTGNAEIDQMLLDACPDLQPVSRITIDRWKAECEFQTSRLEISVDLGKARGIPGTEDQFEGPIGEVEIELLSGDPEGLFEAAQLMLDHAPLRLEAFSKRESATLISSGRQYAVPDVKPFRASSKDSADAVLQRALKAAAERVIQLQTSIIQGRAPKGVHRMRVELRRLRSIERNFRDAAKCQALRRLAEKARKIGRALGPARDWDVFLDEMMPAIAENRYAAKGFARLEAAAQAHRAEAWADAIAAIADPAFSRFALDLMATAHLKPWRAKGLKLPAQEFGASILDRARRKARKVARDAEPSDPPSLHPLRLALKKLRYGVQLFKGLYPKADRKPYMAAMAKLQDAFGVLNDAVTAPELADKAAAGQGPEAMRAAGFISGYYAARAEAAAKEIDAAWARFEKKQPFWRN